jgi:hypothetical protein
LGSEIALGDDGPVGGIRRPQPPPEKEGQEDEGTDDEGFGESVAPAVVHR